MSDHTTLIDRYIACWNEADPARRRALVAATFSGDASYVDPMMQGDGQAAIEAMIAAAQQQFPGHRFSRRGTPDAHHDRLRFAWDLAPEGGAPVAGGTDVALVAADGRLAAVTGFIDFAPRG